MKKRVRILIVLVAITMGTSTGSVFSQGPPSPSSQSNGSSTGMAPINGSGAPIGNGEYILFALAMLYAVQKKARHISA